MKITDFPAHPVTKQMPMRAWFDKTQDDSRWYCQFIDGTYATYFTRSKFWAPVYAYMPNWLAAIFKTTPDLEIYECQHNTCTCSMLVLQTCGCPSSKGLPCPRRQE
jgi:hypothetical protein